MGDEDLSLVGLAIQSQGRNVTSMVMSLSLIPNH